MKWITAGMNNEAGMKCNPEVRKDKRIIDEINLMSEYWLLIEW